MRVRDPRLILLIAAAMLGAAVAFPLGVIASHQFTDVPDSSTYHDDIDAIRDAGITTGCGLNLYCPKAYVTREQMAAFMNRLGALQAGKTPVVKAATAQNADDANQLDGLESTQFERSDVPNNGHYTCAAPAMVPNVDAGWASDDHRSWATAAPLVYFGCSVVLPDGATMTSVDFMVGDNNAGERVFCQVVRTEWGVGHSASSLGAAATTYAGTPGDTVISWAFNPQSVIDNATYTYLARCIPEAADSSTFIVGVRVNYTLTGLALP